MSRTMLEGPPNTAANLVEEPRDGRRVVPDIHHDRNIAILGRNPIP